MEDEQLRDEPESGLTNDTQSHDFLDHIYTQNLPETREILGEFYNLVKAYGEIDGYDRVVMLETYYSPEEMVPYYEVSDYPFNMNLVFYGDPSAERVMSVIQKSIDNVPEGKVPNWVVSVTEG